MVRLLRLLTYLGGMPTSDCVVSNSPFTRLDPTATLHMAVVMAISVALAISNGVFLIAVNFMGIFSFYDFYTGLRGLGMSVTDTVAVGGFLATNSGLFIPCVLCVAARRRKMAAAHLAAAGLKWLSPHERDRIERAEALVIGLLYALTILCISVAYYPSAGMIHILGPKFPYSLGVINGILIVTSILFSVFSPLVATMDFVVVTTARFTSASMRNWAKACSEFAEKQSACEKKLNGNIVKNFLCDDNPSSRPAWPSTLDHIEELVAGAEIHLRLARDINAAFGGYILNGVTKATISTISCLLFVSTFYEVWDGEDRNHSYQAVFIIACAISLVFFTVKMIKLAGFGQELTDLMEVCKLSAQELKVECSALEEVSPRLSTRLDNAIENLGSSVGLNVSSCFVLGRASTLSIIGLLITYFIVLFQFNVQ